MNKVVQVSNGGHQMSLAGGPSLEGGQGWVWGSPCSISVREGRGGEGRAGTEEGPCTYSGGGEVHIRL